MTSSTMAFYKGMGAPIEGGAMWMHVPPAWDFSTTPKQRWKAQQSALRWERRYGKPKGIFKGEIGSVEGVRFIRSTP